MLLIIIGQNQWSMIMTIFTFLRRLCYEHDHHQKIWSIRRLCSSCQGSPLLRILPPSPTGSAGSGGIDKKWWFGEWRKFAINWINDVLKNNDDLVSNSAGNPGYSHLAEDVELCSKVVVRNLIETSCVRPLILSRGKINMIRKKLTGCKKVTWTMELVSSASPPSRIRGVEDIELVRKSKRW